MAQNRCGQVQNAQYVCVDCKTLGYCSQVNGVWQTISVGECLGSNYFCNDDVKGCSYSNQCDLSNTGPNFQCQNPGIYPDPYNCKYYHNCSPNNVLTTSVCNNGLGYSLQTGSCSLSKTSKECKERQYTCDDFGQTGLWPADDNIFYVCLPNTDTQPITYYPLLYRCPVGQIFLDYRCVSKNGNSATTPPPCIKNTLIPDPSNCAYYYKCGETTRFECSFGTHFDATKQSCVIGMC